MPINERLPQRVIDCERGKECERTFAIAEPQITSIENLPEAVVVHVMVAELGKKEVDQVCKVIDEARLTAQAKPFILEMAKVGFVPSVGMGVLVGLHQEFRGRGQRLIFAGMQDDVSRSFTITKIHRIMEIIDDLPTALRSVGAGT